MKNITSKFLIFAPIFTSVFFIFEPVKAEIKSFTSVTQFQVCGEDSRFVRPSTMNIVNKILLSERWSETMREISILPSKQSQNNDYIVSRIAGKLYTSDAIIFSSASTGITYDTKILSGMKEAKVDKWNCSDLIILQCFIPSLTNLCILKSILLSSAFAGLDNNIVVNIAK